MIRKKYRIMALAFVLAFSLFSFSACEDKDDATEESEYILETIEEQVLFDEAGVKVIAKSIVDTENYGKGIALTFENNNIKALTFDCKKMIINGIMAPDLFGDRVEAGGSVDIVGYFGSGMMNYIGIDNVGEIQLEFDCYDTVNYTSVYKSDLISVKTSEYENMDTEHSFDGEKLFEGYGLTIYGKMASDDIFDNAMLFYMENDSDKDLFLKSDGVTIDDVLNEYLYAFKVFSHSDKLFYLEFGGEEAEGEALEGTDFEMEFEVLEAGVATHIGETGPLKVSVK